MTPESELVLAIAKETVFGEKDRIAALIKKGDINWTGFKNSLTYHGLTCFAYLGLKKFFSFLPKDLIKALESTYHYYLMYATYLEQEFLALHRVF